MPSLSPANIKQLQDLRFANDFLRLRTACQKFLTKDPQNVMLNAYMAQSLRHVSDFKTALFYAKRASELAPQDSELKYELAFSYWKLGRVEEGVEHAAESLHLNPHAHHAHQLRIKILEEMMRFNDMAEAAEAAVQSMPTAPGFRAARSLALATAGRSDEAALKACQSLLDFPSSVDIAELACFCHNYVSGFTRERVFEVHRNYGRLLSQTAPAAPVKVRTDPDPNRQIRVGVISSDLRNHSVGYFIEPFFRHYDKKRFHVRGFACGAPFDPVARRLASLVDGWHPDALPEHTRMVEAVRSTQMDILIDLNGITQGNMLHTLHLRAAPIQVTYIGYPNTTGVPNIDYRIVDSLTDPAGDPYSADAYATEKLVRIDPCFLCYEPRMDADYPAPGDRPINLPDGTVRPIVFASFNATFKVNDRLIALWKRVIEAVPGSKLIIKAAAIRTPGMVSSLQQAFARNGFDIGRLDVRMGTATAREHLSTYQEVDIALDTFPYHGTTTTCEALVMGVPVITLAGAAHASRVGLSLLTNAGLPELVAHSEDEYVQVAANLAGNRAALRELQQGVRPQLLGSALCNGEAYAARMQEALVAMWQRYCQVQSV